MPGSSDFRMWWRLYSMKLCQLLENVRPDQKIQFGGKAAALAGLAAENFNVPLSLCISTAAYRQYLQCK